MKIFTIKGGPQNGGMRNRLVGVGSVKSLEFASVKSGGNLRESDEVRRPRGEGEIVERRGRVIF